jgi:hypothetical protein
MSAILMMTNIFGRSLRETFLDNCMIMTNDIVVRYTMNVGAPSLGRRESKIRVSNIIKDRSSVGRSMRSFTTVS